MMIWLLLLIGVAVGAVGLFGNLLGDSSSGDGEGGEPAGSQLPPENEGDSSNLLDEIPGPAFQDGDPGADEADPEPDLLAMLAGFGGDPAGDGAGEPAGDVVLVDVAGLLASMPDEDGDAILDLDSFDPGRDILAMTPPEGMAFLEDVEVIPGEGEVPTEIRFHLDLLGEQSQELPEWLRPLNDLTVTLRIPGSEDFDLADLLVIETRNGELGLGSLFGYEFR